jgi:hypothetical protein
MALFNTPFTNIFWKGEVYPSVYDAEGDYYLVTDAQTDHNYLQEKIWDIIGSLSNSPSTDCQILYGGVVSDGGSGTVNITECVAKGFDSDGNKRIIYIPAQTGISIPSGWNDGRQIYVLARYDYKLGALTRTHKGGTTYHHEMKDTYMGDSNGYVSTGTVDFFTDTPGAITDVVLGRFTMTGTTYADTTSTYRSADVGIVKTSGAQTIADVKTFSSIPVLPASDPTTDNQAVRKLYVDAYHMKYDYIVDSQAKFDALVASGTWLNAKNVLFTTNVTRAAQTTIPATVEKIHAINGATLTATNLTSGQYALGYATRPVNMIDYEMVGIKITVTIGGTNSDGYTKYGFYNINNMRNCYIYASNSDCSTYFYGFSDCYRMYNCHTNFTISGQYNTGFINCYYLVNCAATVAGGIWRAVGFSGCYYLTNCYSHCNTNSSSGGAKNYCFSGCNYLSTCHALVDTTITYDNFGFSSCNYLSSCEAIIRGNTYNQAPCYSGCNSLVGCVANCTGVGASRLGYINVNYASACRVSGAATAWSGTNTKIRGCEGVTDDA